MAYVTRKLVSQLDWCMSKVWTCDSTREVWSYDQRSFEQNVKTTPLLALVGAQRQPCWHHWWSRAIDSTTCQTTPSLITTNHHLCSCTHSRWSWFQFELFIDLYETVHWSYGPSNHLASSKSSQYSLRKHSNHCVCIVKMGTTKLLNKTLDLFL